MLRPLGERAVVDALSDRKLPYRNIWAEGRITIADDFDETPDDFAEYTA